MPFFTTSPGFSTIKKTLFDKQVNKLGKPEVEVEKKDEISIDKFFETRLKVAQIIEAEKVEKSDKLMKLILNLGDEKRQVVAGIAKSYNPEDLVGKKIVIVANLKPAKLFGLESQGMILAAENGEGQIKVLEVDNSVEPGTKVK
jgi:methionyl-tRNA synthetase